MGFSIIEIDAGRLLANVGLFRRLLGEETRHMAVAKANAYGHGARVVAPLLEKVVDWLGVDGLDEAEELLAIGVEKPILILGHTEPEQAERVVEGGFRQVVFRRDVADALMKASRIMKRPARMHVEIETGAESSRSSAIGAGTVRDGSRGSRGRVHAFRRRRGPGVDPRPGADREASRSRPPLRRPRTPLPPRARLSHRGRSPSRAGGAGRAASSR